MPGKRKGNRREREAEDLWQQAGYRTYKPQESKYGETDMFGLFDFLAHKRTGRTAWVQVKSNGARGIEEWVVAAREFLGPYDRAYMAVCYDREGWRLVRPTTTGGGHRTVVDEREHGCGMGELVVEYLRGGTNE